MNHQDSILSKQTAENMQKQTPRLQSGQIYITAMGNASGEDLQLLYADTVSFAFINIEVIIEEIRNESSIHDICVGFSRPSMLVINADSFAKKANSQLVLLELLNERRRLHKSTFLLFGEETEKSFPGFIKQIAELLIHARYISLTELLDRKYHLIPETQMQKFTDCLVRDIVMDHETEYLVCECFADTDQSETVIAAVDEDTGRYVPASNEEARRILQIHEIKQLEAKKMKTFSDRPDIEREQWMILLDLKANQARLKACRTPSVNFEEGMMLADFHVHTTRSDGRKTSEEILKKAIEHGLTQVAFLDHNTVPAEDSLRGLAEEFRGRIQVVSGSEVSAIYVTCDGTGTEVHIGALGISSNAEIHFRGRVMTMARFLESNRVAEERYIGDMTDKLRAYGFEIPGLEELKKLYPDSSGLNTSQMADLLVRSGQIETYEQAYDCYLGRYGDRKAYVKAADYADFSAMDEVVKIIIEAKRVPVLCHPLKYGFAEEEFGRFIQAFVKAAAGHPAAMEAGYRKYGREQQRALKKLAKAEGLFLSTGSDFHGRFETDDILSPEEIINSGCAGTHHVGYLLCDVLGEPLICARKGGGVSCAKHAGRSKV